MTGTPREVFLRLVHGVADGQWETLPDLYADRTDVRHPMSPLDEPPLTSRDELREHFGAGAARAETVVRWPANVVVHETTDPEVIVAEFTYDGRQLATDQPFSIPCVFVMRIRDGEIVESRDYIDHLRSAAVRGELDDLVRAVRSRSSWQTAGHGSVPSPQDQ